MKPLESRTDLVARTAVIVLTVVLVLGLVGLLYLVGEILLLLLMAAILATGLNPLVDRLERRTWTRRGWRLTHTGAIAWVYAGVLVGLVLIGGMLVTPIVAETKQFVEKAPDLYQRLRELLVDLRLRYSWLPDFTTVVDRLPGEAGRLGSYLGTATGVAFRVFGGIVSAVTVLILSF